MMNGRYGMDQLNRFLLYVALGLVILGFFIRAHWLSVLTVLLMILIFCRYFSRSIYHRQRENMKYLELKSKVFGAKQHRKDAKAAREGKRVLICPYCKEKLRVPVGAGKIKINCPHCHRQFEETV